MLVDVDASDRGKQRQGLPVRMQLHSHSPTLPCLANLASRRHQPAYQLPVPADTQIPATSNPQQITSGSPVVVGVSLSASQRGSQRAKLSVEALESRCAGSRATAACLPRSLHSRSCRPVRYSSPAAMSSASSSSADNESAVPTPNDVLLAVRDMRHFHLVQLLRRGGSPDAREANPPFRTALHLAVQRNDKRQLQALIEYGADLDAVDADGNTALHLAVTAGASDACSRCCCLVLSDLHLSNAQRAGT